MGRSLIKWLWLQPKPVKLADGEKGSKGNESDSHFGSINPAEKDWNIYVYVQDGVVCHKLPLHVSIYIVILTN